MAAVANPSELSLQLAYGWHKAYMDPKQRPLVEQAQKDLECCGFRHVEKDFAVQQSCPSGAEHGCERALVAELRLTLTTLAALEFGGAGLALLAVIAVMCREESMRSARQRSEAPHAGSYKSADSVRVLSQIPTWLGDRV